MMETNGRAVIATTLVILVILGMLVMLTTGGEIKGDVNNSTQSQNSTQSKEYGIKVGNKSRVCDDGKTNLGVDWDGSPVNYTCSNSTKQLMVDWNITAVEECEKIPEGYSPQHYCMDEKIVYNSVLPTHAGHRPVWPMFGEYLFVPTQRWSHSIEHGAIVMVYHPCADKLQVQILRQILRKCLRKHVITRSNLMDTRRPLALIGWGCRLTMNFVDNRNVISFIKRLALKAPEGHLVDDGQYNTLVIRLAPVVSDPSDSVVCPNYP